MHYFRIYFSHFTSSIPSILFASYFVLLFLFLIRLYRYPKYQKNLINLYSIIMMIISILSIIFTLISGIFVYHSLLDPYPFKGYFIILLILNIVILAFAIFVNIKAKKIISIDIEKRKIKIRYIINNIFLIFLCFLAMYRFGSILLLPIYVQIKSFYLTFPFYLWLLIPLGILIHIIFYFLDFYKSYKVAVIYTGSLFLSHLLLALYVFNIGLKSTLFISAVSLAFPLERLASFPLDTYINLFLSGIISLYFLIYSIRSYLKEKKVV